MDGLAAKLLVVVSGSRSLATQYEVLLHPEEFKDSREWLLLTSAANKSMIVAARGDDRVDRGHVMLHNNHAMHLYVCSKERVRCNPIESPPPLSTVSLVGRATGKVYLNPPLAKPIYLAPEYRVNLPTELCVVSPSAGSGLYVSSGGGESVSSSKLGACASDEFSEDSSRRPNFATPAPLSIQIDFCNMGIGGLKEQMNKLIRQVLVSRILDAGTRAKYRVKDVKGILLHGPPGTGKTLIARHIAKIVPDSVVKKVDGPELSSKWVGESEANVRALFEDAKRAPTRLHVIIFDEIDAVGRRRGSTNSAHDDKVLTQLLTVIDGLDSAPNVLVIGITNRPDVLDPALVRAGRLECGIEVPLPTEEGRKEILEIYLKPLREGGLLDEAVDIDFWAHNLEGYSGADIESLVSRAKNLALLRKCDIEGERIVAKTSSPSNGSAVSSSEGNPVVTREDFLTAMAEFTPTFGRHNETVARYVSNFPARDPEELDGHVSRLHSLMRRETRKPISVRISGESGSGRTVLACHLATRLALPYVRYLSYNAFLGQTTSTNCQLLEAAHVDCRQAERAVLVVDDLEEVGDCQLLLRLRHVRTQPLEPGKQLVVVHVTSSRFGIRAASGGSYHVEIDLGETTSPETREDDLWQ